MKTTILIAILVGIVSSQGIGTDRCDKFQFNVCNAKLGEFWQTDTSRMWTQLQTFGQIINSKIVYPYPIDNFVNICNGLISFYACLGQYNVFNCLSTVGFVGNGLGVQDAYGYQGVLADWQFKCNNGFFTVYEWPGMTTCVQNTYVNYQPELDQYFNAYSNNINADPANSCKYAQTLMNGVGTVYQNGPCRTVDPTTSFWYGCQSGREFTNAQFRHCQHVTNCPFNGNGVQMSRINEKTGETEFLLPEHYEKNNGFWMTVPEKWI